MLDAIEMEQRNIPTITICHDKFEKPARAHAQLQGMPSVPLLIEPIPQGGTISHDVEQLAQEKLPEVIAALTAATPVPVGSKAGS